MFWLGLNVTPEEAKGRFITVASAEEMADMLYNGLAATAENSA